MKNWSLLNRNLVLVFACRTEENYKIKKTIRVVSVLIKIQTGHLQDISLDGNCCTNPLYLTLREECR
jgi:hypothetical protein